MSQRHRTYLSVGSNMGDRLSNCRRGIDAVGASESTSVLRCSRFFRTEPVDFRDQDWFVNAAAEIETALDPFQLLAELQAVQVSVGQGEKSVRFGPRVLDLDIIFYDNVVMDTPSLMIPHPRMHMRHFVLKPICDINPDVVHPVLQKSMAELLDSLDVTGQAVVPYR